MPSASLMYSFPVPVGRRGAAAMLALAVHALIAAALLATLAVSLPHRDAAEPSHVRLLPPRHEAAAVPAAPLPDGMHLTPPMPAPVSIPQVLPPVAGDAPVAPPVGAVEGPVALVPTSPARLLHADEPPYPAAARRLGEQGVVVVRVLVGAIGRVERAEVERSSGSPRLDDAAVNAVRRWQFQPAASGAGPVPSWTSLRVVFRLTR